MRTGLLRHKFILMQYYVTRDTRGQEVKAYVSTASAWGAVMAMGGMESVDAGKTKIVATHQLTIRYNGLVTEKDRLICGDRRFEVVSVVSKDERRVETILLVKELKNAS